MHELWRGNANAWECDEMGHLNVKAYLGKGMQAIARLTEQAGLAGAFSAGAMATLRPVEWHVRFLGEARPGAPLFIEGGVARIGDSDADIALAMRHSGDGRLAATLTARVEHVVPDSGRVFAWPSRFRGTAEALMVEPLPESAPRGLPPADWSELVSLKRAEALRLFPIGLGRIGSEDADVFGRMRPEFLIGKVSDSVANFVQAFPDRSLNDEADPKGGALLECRIRVRRYPRPGDGFAVRSALSGGTDKVRQIVHWVLDPLTGKPWWTVEGIAATLNLRTRRIEAATPAELQDIAKAVRDGLKG
ncbi:MULTISPECIES: thioesterase family protein [Hyphobacterium]|uniref:Thioesterase family protein n=1 Tax=Hyphobacterium vulgare TaxID=1736751 RepID=A0ABV6ZYI9_9PROT